MVAGGTKSLYTYGRLDWVAVHTFEQGTALVFERLGASVYSDKVQKTVQPELCWAAVVEFLRILGGLEWRMSWL